MGHQPRDTVGAQDEATTGGGHGLEGLELLQAKQLRIGRDRLGDLDLRSQLGLQLLELRGLLRALGIQLQRELLTLGLELGLLH